MPSNKNALTRYTYLDEMLSDRHHFYDIHDLTDRCNEKLAESGLPEVTQRCIEKDINYLEYAPFYADIERFLAHGKRCIRYANPSFTIFRKELSKEESNLILEVLNTIGQFEGLAHFEWLNRFKIGLGLENKSKIISFSHNPYLQNSTLLGSLFDAISNQVVIDMKYHTYDNPETRSLIFHPYLLKQYNDRWYVIGSADSDSKILTFALDRIDEVAPQPDMKYVRCKTNLSERFEDIVGITLFEDRKVEHIVFWVSDVSANYVKTKPIHESQRVYKEKESELRQYYPSLKGGMFFSIDCIPNYELIRELSSFGKNLIVLTPSSVQDDIYTRTKEMYEDYLKVRT